MQKPLQRRKQTLLRNGENQIDLETFAVPSKLRNKSFLDTVNITGHSDINNNIPSIGL